MPSEPIFDSHCHLNDKAFNDDCPAVLERAREAGVLRMAVVGYEPESSRRAVELAAAHPELCAVVGIAPHDAHRFGPEDLDGMRELARDGDVVGIGESGLEYHHGPDKARQAALFRAHIRLAEELALPLVIHSRDADDDLWRIIEEEGLSRGVLHCFTGGIELMEHAAARGLYVSISGIVTFTKATAVQEAARRCPLDRLLIETDAPYLAPVPHRGQRNEPSYLRNTLECIANLRKEDADAVARATRENTQALFR